MVPKSSVKSSPPWVTRGGGTWWNEGLIMLLVDCCNAPTLTAAARLGSTWKWRGMFWDVLNTEQKDGRACCYVTRDRWIDTVYTCILVCVEVVFELMLTPEPLPVMCMYMYICMYIIMYIIVCREWCVCVCVCYHVY